MSFAPARVYQPQFWSIASMDPMPTGRISTTVGNTSTAWVANLAVYVPVYINIPCTIYEWWHMNGTLTTSYNVDYGLYLPDFTKVQSLGSTVGTTTASVLVNTTTWTNLDVVPGLYYMAFASDSTRNFQCSTEAVGLSQSWGVMEQTTAFALPSPAVPVTYTRAFVPHFGMNLRATAL